MKISKKIWGGLLALGLLLSVTGCGQTQAATKETTVRVGIMSADEPIWRPVVAKLKQEHVKLKLVEFSDYNQPNKALSDHQIDLNAFQHYKFLDSWNQAHHTKLVALGETYLPRGFLYSRRVRHVAAIKNGAKIAVANDPTNEGRALKLLEQAGLLKLKRGVSLPTVHDISANPRHLKIVELDAAQTARALSEVTAAVVGNDIAADAGLTAKDAIFKERVSRASSQRDINIIAVNQADRKRAVYRRVLKAYRTPAVAAKIKQVYQGTAVGVWTLKQ